jgi:transposase InsO family protein
VTCSMSAVGSCADNAAAESFFGVLKCERVNRQHTTAAARRREPTSLIKSNGVTSAAATKTGDAATAGTTLNSTVRDIGVEPERERLASPSRRLRYFGATLRTVMP